MCALNTPGPNPQRNGWLFCFRLSVLGLLMALIVVGELFAQCVNAPTPIPLTLPSQLSPPAPLVLANNLAPPTPSASNCNIITNGLVLYLDAGNPASYSGSGNTWNDLSGYNHHGTLLNNPTFNSADGGEIIFDGINDYVSIPYTQTNVTSYTIEVWYKSTDNYDSTNNGLGKSFVSNRGAEWGGGISLDLGLQPFYGNSGSAWFGAQGDEYINQIQSNDTNFNNGSWRQLVGVFTQEANTQVTTNSFKLYANGVEIGANSSALQYSGQNSPLTGLGPTHLMYVEAWNTYTLGSLAVVRIYSKALTSSEILQNFNEHRARFGL